MEYSFPNQIQSKKSTKKMKLKMMQTVIHRVFIMKEG